MPEAPLHVRIAADLRGRIARGELAVGQLLPSEADLCDTWGVSRGPVRQALQSLRASGMIGGGPGRPPVVRSRNVSQPFATLLSFSQWVHELGNVPGQRTLEVAKRPASDEVATALDLPAAAPVVHVLRVRSIDGAPTMIERSCFVEPVGRLLFDFDCDSGSIYSHLAAHGVHLTQARHVIDAVAADAQDAQLLGIAPGAPLLRERRVARGEDDRPYEFSDDRYRPELVSFSIANREDMPAAVLRTAVQPEEQS